MRGKMEPFAMSTLVKASLIMVHAVRQIVEVPHMTTPRETQLREQKQEVPQMTSP
jgi:hypothetical protein